MAFTGEFQKPAQRTKLSPTVCQAASTIAVASDLGVVIVFFMALLSFCGFVTPSLSAQGEQRRSFYFNSSRDIPVGGGPNNSAKGCAMQLVGHQRKPVGSV